MLAHCQSAQTARLPTRGQDDILHRDLQAAYNRFNSAILDSTTAENPSTCAGV
jgi:hypothetical protein